MATLPSNAKLIKTVEIEFQYGVQLYKTGKRFAVVYGADVQTELFYSEAALVLGRCIMHAWACNGANLD